MTFTLRQLKVMAREIESVAEELVSNRMEEVDPTSRDGKELIASAKADAEDLAMIASFLKIGKIQSARRAIRELDTVARDYIPGDVFEALFPSNRLEEDFKKTCGLAPIKENTNMATKIGVEKLKEMVREALAEQSAKGAGVNTAIAPPSMEEQNLFPGGERIKKKTEAPVSRRQVFEITGPSGYVEAYASGTDESSAKVSWLMSLGQPEAAAINNMHHYGANAMSPISIQKIRANLEDQIAKLEERREQLEAAVSDV